MFVLADAPLSQVLMYDSAILGRYLPTWFRLRAEVCQRHLRTFCHRVGIGGFCFQISFMESFMCYWLLLMCLSGCYIKLCMWLKVNRVVKIQF